jgi:hypothetical protein
MAAGLELIRSFLPLMLIFLRIPVHGDRDSDVMPTDVPI